MKGKKRKGKIEVIDLDENNKQDKLESPIFKDNNNGRAVVCLENEIQLLNHIYKTRVPVKYKVSCDNILLG